MLSTIKEEVEIKIVLVFSLPVNLYLIFWTPNLETWVCVASRVLTRTERDAYVEGYRRSYPAAEIREEQASQSLAFDCFQRRGLLPAPLTMEA